MTDQIEMWWKCSACGTLNGGLSKRCGERVIRNGQLVKSGGGCGKPLDHMNWIMPDDISTNANLTDTDQVAQAKEGPDWKCEYCGGNQRNSRGDCISCGGDRAFSAQREKEAQRAARRTERRSTPPSMSYDYSMYDRKYENPRSRLPKPALIGIIAGAVALVGLIIWIFMPRHVNAEVKSVAWTSVVHVERFKRIHDDGWDAPGDAEDIRSEGRRVHHYDHVRVGSHQESYTERVACGQDCRSVSVPRVCTSNSNGTASCSGGGTRQECSTRYCNETRYRTVADYEDQPRYRTWYSWYAWRWRHQRDVRAGASDIQPHPPTPAQIELSTGCSGREQERQSAAEFTYQCNFADQEGESFVLKPTTETEFKQCTSGRPAKLKIVAGSVSVEEWR